MRFPGHGWGHRRWMASMGGLVILLSSMAQAGDAEHPDPGCLPLPLDSGHFASLRSNSPFTRILSLSDAFSLTGVARIHGKPVATLRDRKTEKTILVSDIPNERGWKLVGIEPGTDLTEISATISIEEGAELATVQFAETQLKPAPVKHQYDQWGRAIPSQRVIDKFRKLNREQMGRYQAWRAEMVRRNPEMDKSLKRFPHIERAMDAILAGKQPRPF